MGSYEQAMDVGNILLQALGELKDIRKQMGEGGDAGGGGDTTRLDTVLSQAEYSLRDKAEQLSELILQEEQAVDNFSPVKFQGGGRSVKGRRPKKLPHIPARDRYLSKTAADPNERLLGLPQTGMARDYIENRFRVSAPSKASQGRQQGAMADGTLLLGPTTRPGNILPKAAREDPYYIHQELQESDVDTGVFNLVNRGFLPRQTDMSATLSGGGSTLRMSKLSLRDPREQFNIQEVATHASAGYDLQNVKLDLLSQADMPVGFSAPSPDRAQAGGAQSKPESGAAAAAATAAARQTRRRSEGGWEVVRQEDSHDITHKKDFNLITPRVAADMEAPQFPDAESFGRMEAMLAAEQIGPPRPADTATTTSAGGPSPPPRPSAAAAAAAADKRGYEQLLDQFSLHEFLIRRGATLDTTPEFLSFRRAFEPAWHLIADLIVRLEEVCRRYIVPLAVIDGKVLASMAISADVDARAAPMRGKPPPPPLTVNQLMGCMKNLESVAKLVQQPGRQFMGPDGQEEAAVCMQRHVRGMLTRRKLRYGDLVESAVIPIQRQWRIYLMYKRTQALVAERHAQGRQYFAALQAQFVRDWAEIQRAPRVIVHLPSFSLEDADYRMSLDHMRVRQNAQLSRLCDLADPNVEVVMVAPFPLPEDMLGYYSKLLQVGGVEAPEQRQRVVVPEYHDKFPAHFSLSRLLYYSSYALKRIKAICRGRSAYIVPGRVGEEELLIATRLGLPLLGVHPGLSASLSRKSVARTLFKEAEVNVAPGVELPPGGRLRRDNPLVLHYQAADLDPLAREHVIETLAQLIVEHPNVPRWILKIDDEHGGRGHAWLDMANIKSLEMVLGRLREVGSFPPPLARQREAVNAVEATLRRMLHRRVALSMPSVYPTWDAYLLQLLERGGVIEASPALVTGSPSVNVLIDPTGQVQVLSTHEQIFCPAYRFIGASFPQSSVPHAALAQAAEVVGITCFRSGIIGHVGMDFLALRENGNLRLWAVDLNLHLTATQASFKVFHFVCRGNFEPRAGTYMVEMEEEVDQAEEKRAPEGSELSFLQGGQESARASPVSVQQRRFYAMNDYLSHASLSTVQYTAFFNRCRLDGVCFDMQERVGTAFNLMDSFASGVLGILCVGHSPQEAFRELADALDFIARQVGNSDLEEPEEDGSRNKFRGIHMTIKYLADKLNASATALLKQHAAAQAVRDSSAESGR